MRGAGTTALQHGADARPAPSVEWAEHLARVDLTASVPVTISIADACPVREPFFRLAAGPFRCDLWTP